MEDKQFEEFVDQISTFLEDEDLKNDKAFYAKIRSNFLSLHVSEQAEVISHFKGEERDYLISALIEAIDPEVLIHFETAVLYDFIEAVGRETFGKMLSALSVNLAVSILSDFPKDFKKDILEFVQFKKRIKIKKLLSYPQESVGRNMSMDFLSVSQDATVKETLTYIHKNVKNNEGESKNLDVFVLNENRNILGSISILDLIKLKGAEQVKNNLKKVNHIASTFDDIHMIVEEFIEYHLQIIPVIDGNKELVGVLEINNIAGLIREEAEKNLLTPAGIFEAKKEGIFGLAKARFGWIFINLFTASLASSLISFFEPLVASFATLAVLTPIVASIGGNTGNQSAVVIIRSLAVKEFESKLILREVLVSLTNSIGFSSIAFIMSYIIYHNLMLSLSFGLAILINLNMGGIIGSLIPTLVSKFKIDPAICSSIFVTMITDMAGFFSFLGIAYILL